METDHYAQELTSNNFDVGSCFFSSTPFIIGVIVLLVIVAGLVSGSKVAFLSLDSDSIQKYRKSGRYTSRVAVKLIERIEELLALVTVLNCFNYTAIASLSFFVAKPILASFSPIVAIALTALVLLPVIMLFCEVMPKMFARHSQGFYVSFMAVPLYFMSKLLKPATFLMTKNNRGIERQVHKNQSISMDELSDVIEENSTGLMSEREMLKGIIEFGNIEVSEIMCPRVDMVAIESKEPFEQVLKKITESGYSRIPVYTDTFDQISGILYIKDLLPYVNNKNGFKWMTLIRPPHFVPENKKINELLEELQMQKNHMAIVVDEYGGTSGLVTMEDIIEMIVGDISDEFDEEESDFTRIDENTYIFKGKTLLSDFCDELSIDSETFADVQGESESVAGLILEMKGELPRKNERFECCGFEFTVLEVDRRRITSVKVHRKIEEKPTPDEQ